jgi:mono/diheme cytochrome c family protein
VRTFLPLALALALPAPPILAAPPKPSKPWPAPAAWREKAPPFEVTDAQVQAGAAIFKQLCVSCHGTAGNGNGPIAKMLSVSPGDLTRPRTATAGELYWKVTTGRFPMPSYEDRLKEVERWQVALYTLGLAKPAAEAGGPGQ